MSLDLGRAFVAIVTFRIQNVKYCYLRPFATAANNWLVHRMRMDEFLWLPSTWEGMSLFCYCTSQSTMSVTLAAAIISLLPAAVGFHSRKDNIQRHFAGKKRQCWVKTFTTVSDSVVKLNSEVCSLACFLSL